MSHFKLEPVLKYKKKMEENLAQEVAKYQNLLMEVKKRFLQLQKSSLKIKHQIRKEQNGVKSTWELVYLMHYLTALEQRLKVTQQELDEAQKNYDQALLKLVETSKERKILEKLKEKWWLKEQLNLKQKEQYLLDEVGINGFVRKRDN